MASDDGSRTARYREISYRLWRMSLDQSKDISFEVRSRLATIADELQDFADRVEDEIGADALPVQASSRQRNHDC